MKMSNGVRSFPEKLRKEGGRKIADVQKKKKNKIIKSFGGGRLGFDGRGD